MVFNGIVSLRALHLGVRMDFLWIFLCIFLGFMLGFMTFGMLQMSRDTGEP